MNTWPAFVLLLLFATWDAWAEGNCPQGYYPVGGGNGGWAGCAPIPGAGGGQSTAPPDTGPQWAKRWGAIAYDSVAGSLGGADGMMSKRKADKAALSTCKKKGGKSCKVIASYYNQCGAMAWGNGFFAAWRAPEREQAESNAINECSQGTGQCQVFYSGCSYPVRVR